MANSANVTVLHYVGYDRDHGGIVSIVRALAATEKFRCVLGVNAGCVQRRTPPLESCEFPAIAGEGGDLQTFWRARTVAQSVRAWLADAPNRIFHGHSRAGLAVACWLQFAGERRVVASVHCYGKRRWFYRWSARRLGGRFFWLTPAMKRYYGVEGGDGHWAQCIPGCVPLPKEEVRWRRPAGSSALVRIGGVGALVSWKQWDLVLDALRRLSPAAQGRIRFAHIGGTDGSRDSDVYAETLRRRTVALGLRRIVEWRGEQPSADAFLREQDCLVSPACQEPFSIAVLEALALGVPVLAANSGGAADVIQPSRNGWLFRSGDPSDLARAFERLIDSDAWQTVASGPEALRRFSADVVGDEWAQVYARVLGRSGRLL